MGRYGAYSSALPPLMTEGPDIAGAMAKGEAIKSAGLRNALAEQELRDYPEKKAREKESWELGKKATMMKFENDVLDYFQKSLAGIDTAEWPQFRKNMIDKGMGDSYLPEAFNTPQEYETWKTKAMEKAEDRRHRLDQEFQKEQQTRGFTHTETMQKQTQEAAETRQTRSEASAERRHEETLAAQKENRPMVETEEGGFLPPDEIKGKTSPRWKTDKKLTPEAEVKKDRLMKEYEVNLKSISDALTKPADKETAKKRNEEIKGELDSLTGAKSKAPTEQGKATADQQVKRLAAAHATLYKQSKDPMADPKVKAATVAFLRQHPEMQTQFLQELKTLYPQGKFDIQGPQTPTAQTPVQPQVMPQNALGGEVAVNPYMQNVPQGLPSRMPNALVQPRTMKTGHNLSIW